MKRYLLIPLVIFCASLILINCEKDKDNSNSCKIIRQDIISDSDTGSIEYTYDSKGRITKTDYGEGLYTTYSYASSEITKKDYTSNAITGTTVYSLIDGLATTATYTKAGSSNSSNITTYEYDYDGYLEHETTIKTSDANDVDETWYYYDDGNLTSKDREHTNSTTDFYSETEYEYYTDKPNKSSVYFSFMGKQNTNLVKKQVYTFNYDNTINTVYAYEFNSDNYVIKTTQTMGTTMTVFVPVYDCN